MEVKNKSSSFERTRKLRVLAATAPTAADGSFRESPMDLSYRKSSSARAMEGEASKMPESRVKTELACPPRGREEFPVQVPQTPARDSSAFPLLFQLPLACPPEMRRPILPARAGGRLHFFSIREPGCSSVSAPAVGCGGPAERTLV